MSVREIILRNRNIASALLVHEWFSHGIEGYTDKLKSHRLAYKNIINFKELWDKTTDKFKSYTLKALRQLTEDETGRPNVDSKYMNLYKRYVKKLNQ